MSRQYHYLIAGFPDLFINDTKLSINSEEFKESLSSNLHPHDYEIIKLFYYRYDNTNILERLQNPDSSVTLQGNIPEWEIDTIIASVKDGSYSTDYPQLPAYFNTFIEAYKTETPIDELMNWDLQLSALYYDFAASCSNSFVAQWFSFEKDLMNIITATQCRNYNTPAENQLIGKGELYEKLIRSNARDFGIDNDFPFIEQIIKASEEENLLDFEKKIDHIKWGFLDEQVFFHYFSIEKLFSFVIKLSLVERWLGLDEETGRQLFKELLNNMESSFEFPEEFTLKNK